MLEIYILRSKDPRVREYGIIIFFCLYSFICIFFFSNVILFVIFYFLGRRTPEYCQPLSDGIGPRKIGDRRKIELEFFKNGAQLQNGHPNITISAVDGQSRIDG